VTTCMIVPTARHLAMSATKTGAIRVARSAITVGCASAILPRRRNWRSGRSRSRPAPSLPHHYSMFLKLQPFKEVKDSEGPEDNSWHLYPMSKTSRPEMRSSHMLRWRFPLILFSSIVIILLVLLILRFWLYII
jgi:hypothetical protein